MPGAFSHIKLTDKLRCQANVTPQVVYGRLDYAELKTSRDRQAVDDQEWFNFSYNRLNREGDVRDITAQMRAGRVVAIVMEDGSIDSEWRVGVVDPPSRGGKGIVNVQCVPLWLDLVERSDSAAGKGWVSDVVAGVRNFDYEITERTPSSILSTYVIPNCPSWVTLGTVDPTYVIKSLSVNRMTPGALVLAVRDHLRSVDVVCEARLRMNGTTDYKLDLVTQIGASATTPIFHPSNALVAMQQKIDPTSQATRLLIKGDTAPDGLPGQWGIARWKVVSVVGNVVTLADRNGGASPIAFDNEFVTNYLLRPKTGRTFAITASSASAGSVTCGGGVSTLAADEDVEFRLDEPLTNTRTSITRYAVSAVPDGTHITLGVSAPIIVNDQYVDWYAKVWSAASAGSLIAVTRISASVAATDVLTVASSAGVTNTHYVEFVQLDGAGEIPSAVDHPLYSQPDPVGYGIKVAELSRPAIGVTQLVPNAWMRTWTNPANPPDGWTTAARGGGGPGVLTRESVVTRYGGYSWKLAPSVGGATSVIYSPIFYPDCTEALNKIAARCWVYFELNSDPANDPATLELYTVSANGTLDTLIGSSSVAPLGAASGITEVDVGSWVELFVEDRTLNPDTAPTAKFGVIAKFDPGSENSGGTGPIVYVDAIEVYPFAERPGDDYEFGDAPSLLQAGNNQLRTAASPPRFYQFSVRDLERSSPSEYARWALTLGGNVRAADVEYGSDTTVRLLVRERDLLDPTKTELTLANRPTLITDQAVADAATTEQAIAAAAQSSGAVGEGFTALTTATTLTLGATISTPMAGAPTVVMPSIGPGALGGASVTYIPLDPSTSPRSGVAVGTPPDRARRTPASRAGSSAGTLGTVGVDAVHNDTVIGYQALFNPSRTGVENTAYGHLVLTNTTTGSRNAGGGHQALTAITTGFDNAAWGWRALFAATVAYGNCAFGSEALTALVDGYTNTAIAITSMVRAVSCFNCTAVGVDTLQFITTSASHSFTAVGSNALGFGDGGHSSTAVGWRSNTQGGAGIANASIGLSSLEANVTGTLNFAGGTQSLYSNLGSYNTAAGTNVFLNNVSGNRLVGLGFCAGAYELGSDALYIDNQDRGSTANDKAKALIYGIFDAAAANQRLRFNAKVGIGGAATATSPLNITALPTSAAGLATGDVWNSAGTLKVA